MINKQKRLKSHAIHQMALAIILSLSSGLIVAQSTPETGESKKTNRKSASANTISVAGVTIDRAKLEFLIKERLSAGQADSPSLREALATELVQRELMVQEAKRKGLDKQPDSRISQDIASDRSLAGIYINQLLTENPISEDAMKKEYEDSIKRAGSEEVLIRQILVPSQEDAKGVLARLAAGEKFDDLAKRVSRDPASRTQGGLTNWVPSGFLQPKLAEAIKGLGKGAQAKEAIQTPAGWHVIRLEDKRSFAKPSYESARGQIRQRLQQKVIDDHVKALLAKSQLKN
jgi:peptidyl-prolyl cis-trans isomerase C